jgi:hypothetical protein
MDPKFFSHKNYKNSKMLIAFSLTKNTIFAQQIFFLKIQIDGKIKKSVFFGNSVFSC